MDIEAVFNNEFEKVYLYFYRKTFHEHLAQDLTSKTFLRFAEKARDQLTHEPRAFLYGVSKNIWLEYLREKYADPVFLDDISDVQDNSSSVDDLKSFADGDLVAHVDKLPIKQRIVVELKYVNNLSVEEISSITGKDANYIKTTHRRAIISLRRMLGVGL